MHGRWHCLYSHVGSVSPKRKRWDEPPSSSSKCVCQSPRRTVEQDNAQVHEGHKIGCIHGPAWGAWPRVPCAGRPQDTLAACPLARGPNPEHCQDLAATPSITREVWYSVQSAVSQGRLDCCRHSSAGFCGILSAKPHAALGEELLSDGGVQQRQQEYCQGYAQWADTQPWPGLAPSGRVGPRSHQSPCTPLVLARGQINQYIITCMAEYKPTAG